MFTKVFALITTAAVAALTLEMIFGFHLGIGNGIHHALGAVGIRALPPL